jgi:hypothetical protein
MSTTFVSGGFLSIAVYAGLVASDGGNYYVKRCAPKYLLLVIDVFLRGSQAVVLCYDDALVFQPYEKLLVNFRRRQAACTLCL